jgi:hypothetical protein
MQHSLALRALRAQVQIGNKDAAIMARFGRIGFHESAINMCGTLCLVVCEACVTAS